MKRKLSFYADLNRFVGRLADFTYVRRSRLPRETQARDCLPPVVTTTNNNSRSSHSNNNTTSQFRQTLRDTTFFPIQLPLT